MGENSVAVLALGAAIYGGGAYVIFLVLRAVLRWLSGLSVDGAARKAGQLTSKVEDAFREGRGK